MDSVFLLSTEARARFFNGAAHAIGCCYICLWSYLPQPSNCLFSLDGWFHEDKTSLTRRLFDTYRASFYSVESGCVPGLVYTKEPSYVDLVDSELMNLASTEVQRQFYQESGIKRAVFIGCKNGEVEIGMLGSTNINMKTIQELFKEDFIQQFQSTDQIHRSSSSSSLRSLSVGSPDNSSLFLNRPAASFLPETTMEAAPIEHSIQAISTLAPQHQRAMSAHFKQHNIQFPTPASDDAAIMRAMLTVISSTASSSSSQFAYHFPNQKQAGQIRHSRPLSSFMPYRSNLSSTIEFKSRSVGGQRMIKMSISMLKRINLMRAEAQMRESRPSSSNQLHHMISERKRREKLNKNFHALRMLLPPGSKKDKATVLSKTRDYLNGLKTHITGLEEKNKMLEMQLMATDETNQVGDLNETVEIQVVRSPESTSEMQQISLRITIRQDCDMIDLVTGILECLKEMGVVSLTSVNAITPQKNVSRVVISFHVKAIDWDEESFRGGINHTIDSLMAAPETTNR